MDIQNWSLFRTLIALILYKMAIHLNYYFSISESCMNYVRYTFLFWNSVLLAFPCSVGCIKESFLRVETESVHHAPDSIRYVSQIIIWLFTFRFINDKRHLDGCNEKKEKNPTFDMRRVFISTQVDGILCKTVNPLHV